MSRYPYLGGLLTDDGEPRNEGGCGAVVDVDEESGVGGLRGAGTERQGKEGCCGEGGAETAELRSQVILPEWN